LKWGAAITLAPILLHRVHDGIGLMRLAIVSNHLRVPLDVTEVKLVKVLGRAEIAAHPRAYQRLPFRIRIKESLQSDQRKIDHTCAPAEQWTEEQHMPATMFRFNGLRFACARYQPWRAEGLP
jgi:hypothetical protein